MAGTPGDLVSGWGLYSEMVVSVSAQSKRKEGGHGLGGGADSIAGCQWLEIGRTGEAGKGVRCSSEVPASWVMVALAAWGPAGKRIGLGTQASLPNEVEGDERPG